jgi:solute carrier family 10 (sodium/bile acid cotransporter), member 7
MLWCCDKLPLSCFVVAHTILLNGIRTLVFFQFVSISTLMLLAWYSLKFAFPNEPRLRVMGLFGCTHKTVAVGVPLINAIYEGNASLGLYTLPLLIWHPMQLVIGTLLAPRLVAFVKSEDERLGLAQDSGNDVQENGNIQDSVELLVEPLESNEEGRIQIPASRS